MRCKPVVPRALANRDVDEAITHYLAEDAEQAALGLIDALEQAYIHIGRHPATGSPRYAHELNLPGLRTWPLTRYPHLIFYIERLDHIDVWRVLHGQLDIPAWLSANAESDVAE
ncbi:type II toxin-antitoxin system RelE/ParE family toxin [Aquabacterium sp.]|uniref:type II toxin-antitoxin system RelE/ParE family toxin n=1 Tax=Aquabacterium sp. TaxID=1872578 RepID=UPI0019A4A8B4|nr:type II toxin-antitoxin system RelE/ParE family toxin [Aquabacterium sp.]MBC7700976.1 type II toxin-antitoxin system RelE/ParE family toxin [Aquabacterium sp.]